MPTPEDAKQRAASTYNAAADAFDESPLSLWDYFGKKTVDKLSLATGARVLDVCCGLGASAIPAAAVVGPSGFVIGVDLADKLLQLARAKAKHRALKNIAFHCADMLALDLPADSFDTVICVFGIFFVPDMSSAVRNCGISFARPRPGSVTAHGRLCAPNRRITSTRELSPWLRSWRRKSVQMKNTAPSTLDLATSPVARANSSASNVCARLSFV
jgi:2-polyprenyl-3-methyl-5-hydroxy-6-metoxy-1,4-benzoquinol methylase